MPDRIENSLPTDPPELDHASRAADHLLALVAVRDPQFRATAELHDATAALVLALAAALAAGGSR